MGKMRKVAEVKQSNGQSEGRRSREGKVVTARAREQKDPKQRASQRQRSPYYKQDKAKIQMERKAKNMHERNK